MRVLLKLLAAGLALLLLAAITLPWWFGIVLRPLGAPYGLTFAGYETVGYTRFALVDARYQRPGITITAKRATGLSPLVWPLARSTTSVEVSEWRLALAPSAPRPESSSPPMAPRQVHAVTRNVVARLRTWLPRLTAANGVIERDDWKIPVSRVDWQAGALRIDASVPRIDGVELKAHERDDAFVITATASSLPANVSLEWRGGEARVAGTWWQQPFSAAATFGTSDWLPDRATIVAENWDLAAAPLKLGDAFDRVRGSTRLDWSDGHFRLAARATGIARSDRKLPPLEFDAQADGDRRELNLRSLHLQAPFAQIALSAPVLIPLDGRASDQPAQLSVHADLAQQPWVKAQGELAGELHIAPRGAASTGQFELQLQHLAWKNLPAARAVLRGDWKWPRLDLRQLDIALDESSRVNGHATFDMQRRELSDARLDLTLAPGWAAPLLPPKVAFESLTASIAASGPLHTLSHEGELSLVRLRTARTQPATLAGHWKGAGRVLSTVDLTARTAGGALHVVGSVDEHRAVARELVIEHAGREYLRAVAPAEFAWQALRVSGVRLEGDNRAIALDLALGDVPAFFVSAQNLGTEVVRDWTTLAIPESRIGRLATQGAVRGGKLVGTAVLHAAALIQDAWMVAQLEAEAGNGGVKITRGVISADNGQLASLVGQLPVRFGWSTSPAFELDDRAPLTIEAAVSPESPLWRILADRADVVLQGASVSLKANGTLREPNGTVRINAQRIGKKGEDAKDNAALTELNAVLQLRRETLHLSSATARLGGQLLQAHATLSMNDQRWQTLFRAPREFDWQQATAELTAEQIELPTLARLFPSLPLVQGEVGVNLRFERGGFSGRAQLNNGLTRPLPGLGRLSALKADLALDGRRVAVQNFSAQLGGEPVQLTGEAELTPRNDLRLDLRLQATNVPLVRRPGLLVRTDLDLKAQTPARGPTRITGTVELRDALVMADLAAILPGGPRGATRAPPYFSVPAEPFARWPLDVRIGGTRAVRVRTAVFNGTATPQFHLVGTLRDPRAIGQLTVDEGQVLFPFARFDVQQGAVRLTEANPAQPQLAVNAAAKRLGYELRLEAGGTTAAPTLAFSSNPPLESADILLLVTTGQPPKDETAAPTGTQRLTRLGTFLGRGIFQNFSGGEERLEITSGEQISEAGRETYSVEYKLRDRLSLTGEYDRYDDYNAGIKYRIYTQEGTPRDQRKP